MVSGWMLYFVLVSAMLLGAGMLLEAAARRVGMPQRGIWAGALVASVLLPLLTRTRPQPAVPPGDEPLTLGEITSLSPELSAAGAPSPWTDLLAALPPLDPLLLGVWAGATGVLLLLGGVSLLRLRAAMRDWSDAGDGSRRILISEATGPAVVGLLGRAIVLPRWAVRGDPTLCRLMLAHEEEHLRARDPALLLAATLLVVLLPWNLPLWWQLRRLRLSVEVDCDARVLRRGSDLRSYASLLLEVGRRRAGLDPALLAFAEPASFLERRIRIMTSPRRRKGWILASVCAALSVALVAGACGLDQPTEQVQPDPPVVGPEGPVDVYPTEDEAEAPGTPTVVLNADPVGTEEDSGSPAPELTPGASEGGSDVRPQSVGREPAFSPRDVEPRLLNRTEFSRRLNEAYPSLLREAGIGGRVLLWVRVDTNGGVTDVQVYESSGYEQLDAAAMSVMRTARFSPAQHEGRPVAVWIALPVTMDAADPPAPARSSAPADAPRISISDPLAHQPAFTPREIEPELRNRREFALALQQAYPSALRAAGIGGRVLLWVFVTESGSVGNVEVYESSGHRELDAAAERAMWTAEFSPAMNRGRQVPVWVALPVTLQTTTR